MTVRELKDVLEMASDTATVLLFWDGAPRGEVKAVYKQKNGAIVLAGEWSKPGGYDYNAAKECGMSIVLFEAK